MRKELVQTAVISVHWEDVGSSEKDFFPTSRNRGWGASWRKQPSSTVEGEKHVIACAGHRTELDLAAEGGRGSHQVMSPQSPTGTSCGCSRGSEPPSHHWVEACQGPPHPLSFLLLELLYTVLHTV